MNPQRPQIDLTSDGHVHTRLCNHATGEMEEYVLSAINKGFREIIFLEHLEAGIEYIEKTWLSDDDFDYYFSEGDRLRRKYADQISIGLGVELGFNKEFSAKLLELLSRRQWDRVGLSCHFLRLPGCDHHLNLLSRNQKNIDIAKQFGLGAVLNIYFETLLEAVMTMPATVVCHLDAALRYAGNLSYTAHHFEQLDTLLAAIKRQGLALEINTSGLAIREEPFPNAHILAKALRHDIPLLVGSDAHRPEDVGRFFDNIPAYITSAVSP